jgi:hypothetical protein
MAHHQNYKKVPSATLKQLEVTATAFGLTLVLVEQLYDKNNTCTVFNIL